MSGYKLKDGNKAEILVERRLMGNIDPPVT